jgi:hypothetical protein
LLGIHRVVCNTWTPGYFGSGSAPGVVGVYVAGGKFRRIAYHTSDDGRIVLDSKKWNDFAASRGLAVNSAVLIAFKESMTGGVDVLLRIKILG